MNGMKAKAERRRHANQFTEDGIPRDANDWTEDDWRDLFMAMKWVQKRIRRRHSDDPRTS
jgi:hypothetical protein